MKEEVDMLSAVSKAFNVPTDMLKENSKKKDFEIDSFTSYFLPPLIEEAKGIGRGFSTPMQTVIPNSTFKVLLLLRPVNQNGAIISVVQEILIQYDLDGLLELRRALCKTKFKYRAFVVDSDVLVYDIDVKVVSYQDILSGTKKINQQDYSSDSFLNYYNNVLSKEANEMFNFEYIKEKTIEREKEELSREWCAIDHIIANALSEKDNNSL